MRYVCLLTWSDFRAATPEKHDDSDSPLSDIEGIDNKFSPPKLRRSGRHRVSSPSSSTAPTGTFAYSALHPPPGALPKTLISSVLTTKKPRNSEGWDLTKLMKEKRTTGAKSSGSTALQSIDLSKYEWDNWDKEEGLSDSREDGDSEEGDSEEGGNNLLNDEARRRKLGVDIEDRMIDILAKDSTSKGKNPKETVNFGVRFFDSLSAPDANMQVDEPLDFAGLPKEATGPAADLLRKALSTEGSLESVFPLIHLLTTYLDWYAISSILRSRSLVKPDELIKNGLLPWVVEVALSQDTIVSQSALCLLASLGSCRPLCDSQTISLKLILTSLARLRPNKDMLEALGIEAMNCDRPPLATDLSHAVLRRLIAVVKMLGQANFLDRGDVASTVALLVVAGLDWETPLEIQLDIAETVEVVCQSYCSDSSFIVSETSVSSNLHITDNFAD